jgi:hypothetical protein
LFRIHWCTMVSAFFLLWIFTWLVHSLQCRVHWSGTCMNSFYSWMDTYVKHSVRVRVCDAWGCP